MVATGWEGDHGIQFSCPKFPAPSLPESVSQPGSPFTEDKAVSFEVTSARLKLANNMLAASWQGARCKEYEGGVWREVPSIDTKTVIMITAVGMFTIFVGMLRWQRKEGIGASPVVVIPRPQLPTGRYS